jgi:non-ribosomal peptide synthetase component F
MTDTTGASSTLPELFSRQVGSSPDATAVIFQNRSLSYAELDRRAEGFARHLRAQGVRPESVVAVMLPRCLELVVAIAICSRGAPGDENDHRGHQRAEQVDRRGTPGPAGGRR